MSLSILERARRVCAAVGAAPHWADRCSEQEQAELSAMCDESNQVPADVYNVFQQWRIKRAAEKAAPVVVESAEAHGDE